MDGALEGAERLEKSGCLISQVEPPTQDAPPPKPVG